MSTNGGPFSAIPQELKDLEQWVGYKFEKRGDKLTKPPYQVRVTGHPAKANDSSTWATYDEAVAAYKAGHVDGIGFVFTKDDPYCGIDLDKCRNLETGEIEPRAEEIIRELNSYTEISPSGTGVHIIIKGKLPPQGRRKGQVEMYDDVRFFCMTGNSLSAASQELDHEE